MLRVTEGCTSRWTRIGRCTLALRALRGELNVAAVGVQRPRQREAAQGASAVSVTAASVRATGTVDEACIEYTSIQRLYADAAYDGQCAKPIEHDQSIAVEIVRRLAAVGEFDSPRLSLWRSGGGRLVIQPKRWVVEHMHSWLESSRPLVAYRDRRTRAAAAWP